MENCSFCNLNCKKSFKFDQYKSIKILEKIFQYVRKVCILDMPLSDEDSYISSDDHENKTKQLHLWCEYCGKYVSDKTRQFQSEILLQKNQQRSFSQVNGMRSTSGVEMIVNEKSNTKFKTNPIENLEHRINKLLSINYYSRYKHQLSYLAKFTKHINGEKQVLHK